MCNVLGTGYKVVEAGVGIKNLLKGGDNAQNEPGRIKP